MLMGSGYQGDEGRSGAERYIQDASSSSATRAAEVQLIAEGGHDPKVPFLAPLKPSDRRNTTRKRSYGIHEEGDVDGKYQMRASTHNCNKDTGDRI